ncbi:hypothetical protein [Nocardia barduliensis]|uniref:hypothetical protein n=1 Tax=Nocardia barduliensis TaxID=2736643 RepID=UPI0015736EDB|nr:hypothetical protein [Nocardia barduliensis]
MAIIAQKNQRKFDLDHGRNRSRKVDELETEMDDMRRTEAGGLRATWLPFQNHLISIVAVHETASATPIVSFGPEDFPDLAQARELLPEMAKLWDAVRHDFWTKLIPPQPRCRQLRWR